MCIVCVLIYGLIKTSKGKMKHDRFLYVSKIWRQHIQYSQRLLYG